MILYSLLCGDPRHYPLSLSMKEVTMGSSAQMTTAGSSDLGLHSRTVSRDSHSPLDPRLLHEPMHTHRKRRYSGTFTPH